MSPSTEQIQRLLDRKRFLNFEADDSKVLVQARPSILRRVKIIVDQFYNEMVAIDDLKSIIMSRSSVDRLKSTFAEYIIELFSGHYDVDYVEKRIRVGWTHANVGVSLPWYMCFIAKLREAILTQTHDVTHPERFSIAFNRLISFDQLLATEAYHLHITAELEKRIQEANEGLRAKNRFIASMSHELRTPLNNIIGFSDLLRQENHLEENVIRQYANTIHRNGNNLLVIVDEILELAKAKSGTLQIKKSEHCLDELREELQSTLTELLRNKPQVSPIFDWPDGLRIETDLGKLRQILVNLIANAAKFTTLGTIKVCVFEENGIHFQVSDTGKGIPADQLGTIFGEFVQGEHSTRIKGVGLGLAICKVLVELLGGEITVTSELHRGSCFTLRLPQ